MFNLFGKKPTEQDQRENDRAPRKVGREMERERRTLQRDEKKLEIEIKKMVKEGNREGCKILAKQLVQLRKQKTRSCAASSKLLSIGVSSEVNGANMKRASSMSDTTKTMANMNKVMKPEKISSDMQVFNQTAMKMETTDEMINDTLDEVVTESGDEEECNQVVTQILDEVGTEILGKVASAPAALQGKVGESSRLAADDEIESQLAKLRAP